ncbi:MAG: UDP-N-acetylglucosamine--N-acetylmuramyl-(pentapeptide) pyrophosphoryl-undecaprenol N-acetylglucosamine transferase [Candidatus Caldarchaeum sp.]
MLAHIAVCGIGLGHVSRSLVVANELMSRGHKVSFSAYGQAVEYLIRHGFQPVKVPGVSYGVGWDGGISVKQTIKNNLFLPFKIASQTAAEIACLNELDADVVLSDTRASAVLAAKILGKPVVTMLNQYNLLLQTTRYRWLAEMTQHTVQAPTLVWNMSDMIVIPDLPPPYTISERTLGIPEKQREKTVFAGPLVEKLSLSRNDLTALRSSYGAEHKPLVVIVVSGGPLEKKVLVDWFLSIADGLSDDYAYVLSTANPMSSETRKVGRLRVYGWVEDLDRLLMAADLVVGRSGLTLISKCIAYGKKMLLIPTPHHAEQWHNAEKAMKIGACKIIDQNSLNPTFFERMVELVFKDEEMDICLKMLKKVVEQSGGAAKVAELVERQVIKVS